MGVANGVHVPERFNRSLVPGTTVWSPTVTPNHKNDSRFRNELKPRVEGSTLRHVLKRDYCYTYTYQVTTGVSTVEWNKPKQLTFSPPDPEPNPRGRTQVSETLHLRLWYSFLWCLCFRSSSLLKLPCFRLTSTNSEGDSTRQRFDSPTSYVVPVRL